MKYVKTVEANTWIPDNEAQVDKVLAWLSGNLTSDEFDYNPDLNELHVKTPHGEVRVPEQAVIVLEDSGSEVMSKSSFENRYDLLLDE